jgi:hypothetical protein
VGFHRSIPEDLPRKVIDSPGWSVASQRAACTSSAPKLSKGNPGGSVVKGPAVSPLPTHNSNLSHFSPLVIPTGAKRSGGICSAPCGSLQSYPATVPDQPIPNQPDFAMPGRNTRWSNKINPTESTNQLIRTALVISAPEPNFQKTSPSPHNEELLETIPRDGEYLR